MCHSRRYEEYKLLKKEEKEIDDFFATRETNYFKKKFKVRTMRTVYSVERDIIDCIIKKRFVDPEKQLNYFVLDEETNTYEFEVRNKDQLMIIMSFVQSSSTFRQTATIMQSLKDAGHLVDIGTIHRSNVSNSVCAIVAVNLQVIKQLLKSMWSFCLAFDGGNNSSDKFISIRVRGELHANLLNFHSLAMPLMEAGTGEYQFQLIKETVDVLEPEWMNKVFGLSSDGAADMVGQYKGTVSRLQKVIKENTALNVFRNWCGLHTGHSHETYFKWLV